MHILTISLIILLRWKIDAIILITDHQDFVWMTPARGYTRFAAFVNNGIFLEIYWTQFVALICCWELLTHSVSLYSVLVYVTVLLSVCHIIYEESYNFNFSKTVETLDEKQKLLCELLNCGSSTGFEYVRKRVECWKTVEKDDHSQNQQATNLVNTAQMVQRTSILKTENTYWVEF